MHNSLFPRIWTLFSMFVDRLEHCLFLHFILAVKIVVFLHKRNIVYDFQMLKNYFTFIEVFVSGPFCHALLQKWSSLHSKNTILVTKFSNFRFAISSIATVVFICRCCVNSQVLLRFLSVYTYFWIFAILFFEDAGTLPNTL